jgi:hypothetical protein
MAWPGNRRTYAGGKAVGCGRIVSYARVCSDEDGKDHCEFYPVRATGGGGALPQR